MKKIPTLFERVYDGYRSVDLLPNVIPGMEWVLASEKRPYGEGEATIKMDGSCCAIIDGKFYKRFDAKEGKPIPENAIKCQEEADPVTGHLPCWMPCDRNNPADKWFWEALDNAIDRPLPKHARIYGLETDGTFEAIGPHFGTNPYCLETDNLVRHGDTLVFVERSFEGIKKFLETHEVEGLVFWKDGEPQCKIKRCDFGLPWGRKR